MEMNGISDGERSFKRLCKSLLLSLQPSLSFLNVILKSHIQFSFFHREYFVEMSLKLHNIFHPTEAKVVDKVCLTRTPVAVA